MDKNRFKEIYRHTLKWEGGDKLHNVSGDTGGWTKYGIAYNKNKEKFKSLEEFKNMTLERASDIAYEDYFKPLKLDYVSKEAQAMFFDMAFNLGVKRAIILAQRALKLTDDGIIGNKTLNALKDLDKNRLCNERIKYYKAIVKNNPSQEKFLRGWQNRARYFLITDI